ncbi:MAG: hypothetical protein NTW19_13260 [Planctomycetota bacterium]|nr:hypothetical protein [Planctomycetota bacterium]
MIQSIPQNHFDQGNFTAMTWAGMIIVGVPFFIALVAWLYRLYLGVSFRFAVRLAVFATAMAVCVMIFWYARYVRGHGFYYNDNSPEAGFIIMARGALVIFAAALLAKLQGVWLADRATEAERAPGRRGFHAALSASNLIVAALIAGCAWFGYDQSFWGVLALMVGLLLAYPAMRTFGAGPEADMPAAPPPADPGPERERVLRLLENGTITAEESAELLNALRSVPPMPAHGLDGSGGRGPLNRARKAALCGCVLVLVGFFLPWFSIDLREEMSRMSRTMGAVMPNFPALVGAQPMWSFQGAGPSAPNGNGMVNATVNVAGGDIAHGLGWFVLLLAILAAVLPFVAVGVERRTRQGLELLGLGVGAILLVYVFSQAPRAASWGIFLVIAGYALEIIALGRYAAVDLPMPADVRESAA